MKLQIKVEPYDPDYGTEQSNDGRPSPSEIKTEYDIGSSQMDIDDIPDAHTYADQSNDEVSSYLKTETKCDTSSSKYCTINFHDGHMYMYDEETDNEASSPFEIFTEYNMDSSQINADNFLDDHSYAKPFDLTDNCNPEHCPSDMQILELYFSVDDLCRVHVAEDTAVETFEFKDFVNEIKEKFKRPDFVVQCGALEIQLIKLYEHNRTPSVQLSIVITSAFVCNVYVHRKVLAKNHPVWEGLPIQVDRVQTVEELCERIGKLKVCPGNPEGMFSELTQLDATLTNIYGDVTAHREGDFQALHPSGLEYSSTIRSINCELLTDRSFKCSSCQKLAYALKKRKTLLEKRLNSNRSYVHTSFKHSDMTIIVNEEIIVKLSEQKEKIDSLQKDLTKIKRQFEKEKSQTDNKFKEYMAESSSQVRLFWEQQMTQGLKSSEQDIPWHPRILQWCLGIEQSSTRAYDLMCDSGFICLPTRQEILDHKHNVKKPVQADKTTL